MSFTALLILSLGNRITAKLERDCKSSIGGDLNSLGTIKKAITWCVIWLNHTFYLNIPGAWLSTKFPLFTVLFVEYPIHTAFKNTVENIIVMHVIPSHVFSTCWPF